MDHQMSGTSSKPVALVTGASAGIGSVYAQRLAARGYDLILAARDTARLNAKAVELRAAYGVSVEVIGADLTKPADVRALASKIADDANVTLLVNNAGAAVLGG